MLRERNCCDGRCLLGERCPAFAPGVIDGPHSRGVWSRLRARLRVLLGAFFGLAA